MSIPLKRRAYSVSATALLCLFCAACAQNTPTSAFIITPGVTAEHTWGALSKPSVKSASLTTQDKYMDWWTCFNDPTLNNLIETGLNQSHILAIAATHVNEAEALAGLAKSNRMPQIDGVGGLSRNKDDAGISNRKNIGATLSWDTDIAGVNRRRQDAAIENLNAIRAEYDRTRINLIADIAITYARLRGAQKQLEYAASHLRAQERSLTITRGQRAEGVIGDFDVNRMEAQTKTTRARLPQIETAIATHINRLNTLTGHLPGTLDSILTKPAPIPIVPEKVFINTPIDVLAARPDIQIASFRLSEAVNITKSAMLEVYPNLSLSAFFGLENTTRSGTFHPWSIGASALAPIFHFGRIQSRIDAASAREMGAFHAYKDTILNATAEVENALVAYSNERARADMLLSASKNQQQAANIIREQYMGGEAEQTNLLLSEKDALDAQLNAASAQALTVENVINLFRAMGWGAKMQQPQLMDHTQPEASPVYAHNYNQYPTISMKPIIDR